MIIKGNNEFKKNPSENVKNVKQDDKSDESSKLVKVEILKANENEVTFVTRNADPKKRFIIKYAMFYVIKKLVIFLSLVITLAVLHSLYSIYRTKELMVYVNDITDDLETWRYKMNKNLEIFKDIMKEREDIYAAIIMQANQIVTVNNELESQLQVTSPIFV